jgi:hypothetical protein
VQFTTLTPISPRRDFARRDFATLRSRPSKFIFSTVLEELREARMRLRNMTRGIAVLIIGATATASAAELKVLGGSAVTPAMNELITKFEQAAGHRVLANRPLGARGESAGR